MSVDYIVSSLPALTFGQPPPLSRERFAALRRGVNDAAIARRWRDLETQLRNALAEARGGARFRRPAVGCSLYWKNRVIACFQEHDVLRRQDLLDRVWWDAAGELTPPAAPLGKGALETYAIRLEIAWRRSRISAGEGNAVFDQLTSETKWQPK